MADTFSSIKVEIGGLLYGIPIEHLESVEGGRPIVTVQCPVKAIRGLVGMSGELLPVYSFRRKFGLGDPISQTMFVVTNAQGIRLVLEVDDVLDIEYYKPEEIYEFPSIARNEDTSIFTGVVEADGTLVLIMDLKCLLSDAEIQEVKQLLEDNHNG